ncbi:hypothetical protein Nepgr_011176 [Nepenthes gracilis]|uniref:Uncharacterized protein n=1 Tax=Nepenthes gracilis TaxID=150966 RepID=A0AAD3SDL2_NEPGR|nr:hypothetical protein Nepgr_011176 [Nepenthes gracilis]
MKGGFSLFLVAALLSVISVNVGVAKAQCSYLSAAPGGCPDIKACIDTCRPCYVGTGRIIAQCFEPGGGFPLWRCLCFFKEGAPCPPPPGSPACPRPPPAAAASISAPHFAGAIPPVYYVTGSVGIIG